MWRGRVWRAANRAFGVRNAGRRVIRRTRTAPEYCGDGGVEGKEGYHVLGAPFCLRPSLALHLSSSYSLHPSTFSLSFLVPVLVSTIPCTILCHSDSHSRSPLSHLRRYSARRYRTINADMAENIHRYGRIDVSRTRWPDIRNLG